MLKMVTTRIAVKIWTNNNYNLVFDVIAMRIVTFLPLMDRGRAATSQRILEKRETTWTYISSRSNEDVFIDESLSYYKSKQVMARWSNRQHRRFLKKFSRVYSFAPVAYFLIFAWCLLST